VAFSVSKQKNEAIGGRRAAVLKNENRTKSGELLGGMMFFGAKREARKKELGVGSVVWTMDKMLQPSQLPQNANGNATNNNK
jgi:hypothetical protein